MARKSTLGVKAPQTGNCVSHSHRKTKHLWMPNMQDHALYSMVLDRFFRTSLPTTLLRTIDNTGGLDNYLLSVAPETLDRPMRQVRKLIVERSKLAKTA
ncbi:MAG: 50S ribosomal protein L28 [Magnetococcales bacterium]|nr:50S ribosomal protein L28 [Magnetococcales bacterium]MBF0582940.1 50S ribosomal protein L28 [Magnetococcales bacterium]